MMPASPASAFRRLILPGLLVCTALGAMACGRSAEVSGSAAESASSPEGYDATAHLAELDAWKKRRDERLRASDGWTTLVGLSWLSPGANRVGSAPTADVILPADKAALEVGILIVDEDTGAASFRAVGPVPVTLDGKSIGDRPVDLLPDTAEGGPTVLDLGSLRFHVIERGDRLGVRVRDAESPVRKNFPGLEYFPVDPSWVIEARWEPHPAGKTLPIANVLGQVDEVPTPGVAVFEYAGTTYRLEPILEPGATDHFYVFGDRTNGKETYGAGRFLYAKPPGESGTVTLDFNRSYNPPCVFTAYSTCQLPPPQNKLDIEIRAGEMRYRGPTSGPVEP